MSWCRGHFGDNGRSQLSHLQEIVGHFFREKNPLPDRCKNNPLKHVCLEACNFCLRRWATFDHIKSLPKTALPDHIHIIDVFFVHVYTVFFNIFIYVMCICIIYIYIEICAPTFRLRFLHFGLKKKCSYLTTSSWGYGMGLRCEVQDCRLPKDSRGPQQHASLPCRRRPKRRNVSGWWRDGGLAVVPDVLVSLVFGWWFQTFVYFHPEPWGNDPIWLIFFKLVETTNQVFCVGFCWNCVRNGNFLEIFTRFAVNVCGSRMVAGDASALS